MAWTHGQMEGWTDGKMDRRRLWQGARCEKNLLPPRCQQSMEAHLQDIKTCVIYGSNAIKNSNNQ